MPINWLKLAVEVLLVYLTLQGIEWSGLIKNVNRHQRALTYGVAVVIVLLIFRKVWP